MINRNNAIPMINKQIKIKINLHVVLLSFKRDRRIELIKQETKFTLIDNGFKKEEIKNLEIKEAISTLKKKMELEFPNSHRLYISFK